MHKCVTILIDMTSYPKSGGPISRRVPDGDNKERLVCDTCGYIEYDNPKVVVGVVATAGDRVLLCKRDIEPQHGFWTLPAGFLEHGETAEDGARREAREEANADVALEALLAVYSIPRIGMVQLIYRARLNSEAVSAGHETQAVGLFAPDEIPWDDLAFPSVVWALRQHQELGDTTVFAPFTNPEGALGAYRPGRPAT